MNQGQIGPVRAFGFGLSRGRGFGSGQHLIWAASAEGIESIGSTGPGGLGHGGGGVDVTTRGGRRGCRLHRWGERRTGTRGCNEVEFADSVAEPVGLIRRGPECRRESGPGEPVANSAFRAAGSGSGIGIPRNHCPTHGASWAGQVLAERCQVIPVGGGLVSWLSPGETGTVRSTT